MNNRFRTINRCALRFVKIETQFQMLHRTINKEKWLFHKGDKDSAICIPHGHLFKKERGKLKEYKLELWTGEIYDMSTRRISGLVNSADMFALYNDKVFMKFVDEARSAFGDAYPSVMLNPLRQNPNWPAVNHTIGNRRRTHVLAQKSDMKRVLISCGLQTEWFNTPPRMEF